MNRLRIAILTWLACLAGESFDRATAQTEIFQAIGRGIQAVSVMGAQAEWSAIPPQQLTCIERELRQENLSVDALVRNAIYPSDKRLTGLRDYCAKGPEKSDYEKRPNVSAQAEQAGGNHQYQQDRRELSQAPRTPPGANSSVENGSPEQRLGEVIRRSWVVNNGQNLGCDGRGYEQTIACLSQKGYSLVQEYPKPCTLVSTESQPVPQNAQRRWDGSIDQSIDYPVQKSPELALGMLVEGRIKSSPSFEFYFRVAAAGPVLIKARMSSNPQSWVDLPNPPDPAALLTRYSNAADRSLRYQVLLSEWSRTNGKYRFPQTVPAFEFAPGIDANFIRLSTSPMTIVFGYDRGVAIHQQFISVIKELIAKCGST